MKKLDTANTKLAFNFDYKIAAVCIDLRRRFRNISCKWAVISSAFATDAYRQWSQTVAPRVSQSAAATMIPSWKSHRVCFNCWRSSSMHALPRKFCNLLGWGPGCLVMATNLERWNLASHGLKVRPSLEPGLLENPHHCMRLILFSVPQTVTQVIYSYQ